MDSISEVIGDQPAWEGIAVLLPEPDNRYDRNAVGVYVDNRQVGHLAAPMAKTMRQRIVAAITQNGGVCALPARITMVGNFASVVLDPQYLGALTRSNLLMVLAQAGFQPRIDDESEGFTMRQEGGRYKVFWSRSDHNGRESNVPAMAQAFRSVGLKARVARDGSGYPYVSVSAP